MSANLLRLPSVLSRVPVSRSTLYAMMTAGEFPAPVRLGGMSVAWREEDVTAWIESRPSARAQKR